MQQRMALPRTGWLPDWTGTFVDQLDQGNDEAFVFIENAAVFGRGEEKEVDQSEEGLLYS